MKHSTFIITSVMILNDSIRLQDIKVDEDPDYPGGVRGFTLWWIADEVRLALTELKTFLAENPHNQTFVYSGSW